MDGLLAEAKTKVVLTPESMAWLLWSPYSIEQAEMFYYLVGAAGSEHILMMQFLGTREECEKRDDGSLGAFQAMFSCAYRHFHLESGDWRSESIDLAERTRMNKMEAVLAEAVTYLNTNRYTQISSTSLLHVRMTEALEL